MSKPYLTEQERIDSVTLKIDVSSSLAPTLLLTLHRDEEIGGKGKFVLTINASRFPSYMKAYLRPKQRMILSLQFAGSKSYCWLGLHPISTPSPLQSASHKAATYNHGMILLAR